MGRVGRDQPEELVRELIGDWIASHDQVRLVLIQDIFDQRVMTGFPVKTLLGVGLLADDAGFQDGEIRRGGGGELLGNVLVEVAGESGLRPANPGGVSARDGSVEKAHLGQVAGQLLDFNQETGSLACQRTANDDDFDITPLAASEGGNCLGTILG